jgi:hypothetical protein
MPSPSRRRRARRRESHRETRLCVEPTSKSFRSFNFPFAAVGRGHGWMDGAARVTSYHHSSSFLYAYPEKHLKEQRKKKGRVTLLGAVRELDGACPEPQFSLAFLLLAKTKL